MDLDPAALAGLAIFPLPDIVLFPCALLPLHVFEPRYREMTADVLSSTKLMAVVRLRPGYQTDYEGRPPVFDTAGVGSVISADKLPDGRYHIMLRGVARVRIEEELPPDRAYRTARTRRLGDERSTRPQTLEAAHQELIAACDRLSAAIPEGGESLRRLVRMMPSPGGCADVVAAAVIRDPDLRQTLLELLDPADRLDQVIAFTSALLSRFQTDPSKLN